MPPPARVEQPPDHILEKHPELRRERGETDEAYSARCRDWCINKAKSINKRVAAAKQQERAERQAELSGAERHAHHLDALRRAGLDVSTAHGPPPPVRVLR